MNCVYTWVSSPRNLIMNMQISHHPKHSKILLKANIFGKYLTCIMNIYYITPKYNPIILLNLKVNVNFKCM